MKTFCNLIKTFFPSYTPWIFPILIIYLYLYAASKIKVYVWFFSWFFISCTWIRSITVIFHSYMSSWWVYRVRNCWRKSVLKLQSYLRCINETRTPVPKNNVFITAYSNHKYDALQGKMMFYEISYIMARHFSAQTPRLILLDSLYSK